MALDADKLEKPFRTLTKSLKRLSEQPSPEEIHDVRTRARRVEATLHALLLDQAPMGQKVLNAISRIRKRAGKVRDMDVLIGLVSSLNTKPDDECRLQLIEYLSQRRLAAAKKLHSVVDKRRKSARDHLKRCSTAIERKHRDKKEHRKWGADAFAIALQLPKEMGDWPKLNAKSLHPFRLKVKELRYVLELSGVKDDLVDALGTVKDSIGDWHNWVELSVIATTSLVITDRVQY
jgi:CHAD domain-containing protein